ncbi:nucleotidyl transferase AbiEii/AbiGii toxin family protein [Leptospira meyeri]|uniref:nucleotidyl transferase AbiEii/AbiGii toxin family protein n=1 Tax=Leptospira meyeri TaxID=29508 RepID=UPI0002BE922A|nr:nucleotidyl transferase AbiEii/AbiGii toxin family protein [Leptospira meyeri]EMJ90314.1 nucleotidyl transferase, PF08843 family [Leptospira meyeri serovar Semaranga str. Veldrot Semarang 173]
MHSAVESMLQKYQCKTADDYKHALKEIIQEISLLGLYRSGFFKHAAFYGGTALRIFYKLDRFSEDLDFSLLGRDKQFQIQDYLRSLEDELGSYGFDMSVEVKTKKIESQIQSAFIKGGTLVHLLKIRTNQNLDLRVPDNEQLKIKLEIDIDPPAKASYETKYHLTPIPFPVTLFTKPCLFSGKIHAVLCRDWKSRVKGRDFYDYVWYLKNNTSVDLDHLKARMMQSGHLQTKDKFSIPVLKQMLVERFKSVSISQAKTDIQPFVSNAKELDVWSPEFFIQITKDYLES